ncbi:hypothetical protein H0H92_011056 [Tricholoma furcatifolium]|nr:hypothetical protein H0H92_011056 [Tricholoma furcatifolium]
MSAECNYADYTATYLTYPLPGLLLLPGTSTEADKGCDVWDRIFNKALRLNPTFNIFDTYPILWDVLRFPGSFPQEQTSPLYFDRKDVKEAIHAPVHLCTNKFLIYSWPSPLSATLCFFDLLGARMFAGEELYLQTHFLSTILCFFEARDHARIFTRARGVWFSAIVLMLPAPAA